MDLLVDTRALVTDPEAASVQAPSVYRAERWSERISFHLPPKILIVREVGAGKFGSWSRPRSEVRRAT